MENQEDIIRAIDDFNKNKPEVIPDVLETYLKTVARTGETLFSWTKIKKLVIQKADLAMKDFEHLVSMETVPSYPNVENVTFDEMRKRIIAGMTLFNGAPFTIQRIAELIVDPRKHYKRTDKYLRGIEKNVNIVTTVDPHGDKILEDLSVLNGGGAQENGLMDSPPDNNTSLFIPPAPMNSPVTFGKPSPGFGGVLDAAFPISSLFNKDPKPQSPLVEDSTARVSTTESHDGSTGTDDVTEKVTTPQIVQTKDSSESSKATESTPQVDQSQTTEVKVMVTADKVDDVTSEAEAKDTPENKKTVSVTTDVKQEVAIKTDGKEATSTHVPKTEADSSMPAETMETKGDVAMATSAPISDSSKREAASKSEGEPPEKRLKHEPTQKSETSSTAPSSQTPPANTDQNSHVTSSDQSQTSIDKAEGEENESEAKTEVTETKSEGKNGDDHTSKPAADDDNTVSQSESSKSQVKLEEPVVTETPQVTPSSDKIKTTSKAEADSKSEAERREESVKSEEETAKTTTTTNNKTESETSETVKTEIESSDVSSDKPTETSTQVKSKSETDSTEAKVIESESKVDGELMDTD